MRAPQGQISSIKDMLYPDTDGWAQKYLPNHNNNQHVNNKFDNNPPKPQSYNYEVQKPQSGNCDQRNNCINNNEENIYNILNNKQETMFDQYYADKQRSKTTNHIYTNKNKIQSEETPSDLETNNMKIENLIRDYKEKYGSDEVLEKMINDYYGKKNNITDNCKTEGNNQKKNLQKNNNKNNKNNKNTLILPKIQKNFIRDNRNLVIENKVKQKRGQTGDKRNKNEKHKDFGKIPDYIKKYEMERELKKEELKRKEEESKIPKGTKLLSEEERLATLNGLIKNKNEITNQLEKMPITNRTMAIQKRKEELSQKLEEIESAIQMFSKKRVFVKI